jgi:hypothetical protein
LQSKSFSINAKVMEVEGSKVTTCPSLKGSTVTLELPVGDKSSQAVPNAAQAVPSAGVVVAAGEVAAATAQATSTQQGAKAIAKAVKTAPKSSLKTPPATIPSQNFSKPAQSVPSVDVRTFYSGSPDPLRSVEIPPAPQVSVPKNSEVVKTPSAENSGSGDATFGETRGLNPMVPVPSNKENTLGNGSMQQNANQANVSFLFTPFVGYGRSTLTGAETTAFVGEVFGAQLGGEAQLSDYFIAGGQIGIQRSKGKGKQTIPSNKESVTLTWTQAEFYPSIHVTLLPLGTIDWGVRGLASYHFGFTGTLEYETPGEAQPTRKVKGVGSVALEAQSYLSVSESFRIGVGGGLGFGKAQVDFVNSASTYTSQSVVGKMFLELAL